MKFVYPPRPETIIQPSQLGYYERQNWIGQIKKNGTCVELHFQSGPEHTDPADCPLWYDTCNCKTSRIKVWNRHAEVLKWDMPIDTRRHLCGRVPDGTILVAELLHFKTKDVKNTLYIHDILRHADVSLTGSALWHRQVILKDMFGMIGDVETDGPGYREIWHGVWLATQIRSQFRKHFEAILETSEVNEGLVLKNPLGILKEGDKPDANKDWQVKCRRPTKNYGC